MSRHRGSLVLRPIGRVEGGAIRIHRRWAKGLEGIEDFSHILALFWLHQAGKPALRIHPKGIKALPKLGFLSTRTPHRPNPLGVTVVRLLKRRGSTLQVEGLDAWEGTPILDLKPYTNRESIKQFRVPEWIHRLDTVETDPVRTSAS
ncbi:MAG: tRNA (N6-threonylcarbamoyladenosine(37)-N6)-methyltransferase TrmO [Candidatus Omnitrophica bacterium]|nr:tRNA (N6-threonylcarbamoyladenosine(37)-N6)-methyltransferase TrmO [Candidatus Omnitrophota bacterium]